jgi:hypothetical protein
MKRMILAAVAAALVLLALVAGTARAADPAIHGKFSFSFEVTFPAGTLCDFTYHGTSTVDVNSTYVPATGTFTYLQTQYNTHTNVDTGYTLTEVDQINNVLNAVPGVDGTAVVMGVFWHLRDASGKLVLVKAGELTYDPVTGEVIRFTPNGAFDQTFAQVICPALGGSPA